MARNTNETSTRQLAFAYLDKNPNIVRKEAAEQMMVEFGIGKAYAMTIFQQHRNTLKESGKLTPVYSVKESDNGPSVVTSHVLKASKSDATSPEDAVKAYVADLNGRIASANKIDVASIAKAEAEAKAAVEAEKAQKAETRAKAATAKAESKATSKKSTAAKSTTAKSGGTQTKAASKATSKKSTAAKSEDAQTKSDTGDSSASA